jgi:hypothetical protein
LTTGFLTGLLRFGVAAEGPGRFLARLETVDLDFSRGLRVIFAMCVGILRQ